jgi:hypothetical protein
MKTTVLAVLACLSFSALADTLIDARIERLQRASRGGDIDRLSYAEKEIVKSGLDQALSVLRQDDRRPTPNPIPDYRPNPNQGGNNDWRRNASFNRNDVNVYSDDRCGQIVTEIRPRDNCNRLSTIFGNQRAWSVSLNGQCIDINDTTFERICPDVQNLANDQKPRTEDLVVFTDDRCGSKISVIDPGVDCNALGTVLNGTRAWSVSLNGQCVDINDKTFNASTCQEFQDAVLADYDSAGNRRRGDTVELFTDDRCGNSLYTVKRGLKCEDLNGVFGGQRVWSVRFRGQCVDINDTTFLPACQTYAQ